MVLGISPDPIKAIGSFDQKYDLGFTLLADERHEVAEAYGVWVKKSMYGREYMGNKRTTFVIAPGGTIKDILHKVKPAEHDDLVLAAVGAQWGAAVALRRPWMRADAATASALIHPGTVPAGERRRH